MPKVKNCVTLIISVRSLPYHCSFSIVTHLKFFANFSRQTKVVKLELQSLDGEKAVFVTLQTICEWEK